MSVCRLQSSCTWSRAALATLVPPCKSRKRTFSVKCSSGTKSPGDHHAQLPTVPRAHVWAELLLPVRSAPSRVACVWQMEWPPDIKMRKRKLVYGARQHERAVIPSLFLSLLPLLLPIVPWVGLLVVNSWFPSNQPGMSRTASTFLCVSDRAATLSSGVFHVDTESPPILTSPVKGRGKDDVVSPVARSCLILQTLP